LTPVKQIFAGHAQHRDMENALPKPYSDAALIAECFGMQCFSNEAAVRSRNEFVSQKTAKADILGLPRGSPS
jgi:hypothetical protein